GVSLFMTHTRNSQATYWGADGKLHTAGIDEGRYEYDPGTGLFRGYLIETSATNLLNYSEDFTQWNGGSGAALVTPDAAVAPDGSQTMDKLVETTETAANQWRADYSIPLSTSKEYIFSAFAKDAGDGRYVCMAGGGIAGADEVVSFDPVNG